MAEGGFGSLAPAHEWGVKLEEERQSRVEVGWGVAEGGEQEMQTDRSVKQLRKHWDHTKLSLPDCQ